MTQNIEQLPVDSLTLFDRAYPSYTLMYLLLNQEQPRHFVMRCRSNFNKEVQDFLCSAKCSKVVQFTPSREAIKDLKALGYMVTAQTGIKVRLVKVKLPTGHMEVLLTNLYNEQVYSTEELKEVYALRWQMETTYRKQKSQQQLEVFSGHKVLCIEQDYAAGLLVANLQSLIEKQCESYVQKINERRRLTYNINKNTSWAAMKHTIVLLFLENQPVVVLQKLQQAFQLHLEPVRPNRNYPRNKKARRLNGKYQTFTNYKRAV